MTTPRKITVSEAATIVSRSPKTIYRWIKKGVLSAWDAPDGTTRVDLVQVWHADEEMSARRYNKTRPG